MVAMMTNDKYRIEHDSMGEVRVPEDALWGAQTQRSLNNFTIGLPLMRMPDELIVSFAILKQACARANHELNPERMTEHKKELIEDACSRILGGEVWDHFPLSVFQTGSGTQTNMNVNEVISGMCRRSDPECPVHPNDDVNMSQSSNDTFPTAMNIAAIMTIDGDLIPALKDLIKTFEKLEAENADVVKIGRTHLQDAVPLSFAQESSGWRASLQKDLEMIRYGREALKELAIGATAVGTGLNAPEGFDELTVKYIDETTGIGFRRASNKFHALSSKDEFVFAHGALKALAGDLMKIANDVRWLASGPRAGLGEITIPANEPGSSIMPGKVNPTQCEQVTMTAVQVMGNDAAIGFAASQGNFELNVFMPVIAYNFLQSVRILYQSMRSFNERCVSGIKANREKMHDNLQNSLMLVTVLNPYIGYEKAAKTAQLAYRENIPLKEACLKLGYLDEETFDRVFHPEEMI